jgi:hypothetical protein
MLSKEMQKLMKMLNKMFLVEVEPSNQIRMEKAIEIT